MPARIENYLSPADWAEERPRRYYILRELAAGLTIKQIAPRIGTTHTATRNQCYEMRLDLGAKTNAEAVAIGFRLELLR